MDPLGPVALLLEERQQTRAPVQVRGSHRDQRAAGAQRQIQRLDAQARGARRGEQPLIERLALVPGGRDRNVGECGPRPDALDHLLGDAARGQQRTHALERVFVHLLAQAPAIVVLGGLEHPV